MGSGDNVNGTAHANGAPSSRGTSAHGRIVLVLQGGGALGAYQAGVYQALHEHKLVPDWIVGTSIGAINAALIAGNEESQRLERVKAFWDRVSHPDPVDMTRISDKARRDTILAGT